MQNLKDGWTDKEYYKVDSLIIIKSSFACILTPANIQTEVELNAKFKGCISKITSPSCHELQGGVRGAGIIQWMINFKDYITFMPLITGWS